MNNYITNIANELISLQENIILIYAFNGVGKTRLSVEYKNITKHKNNGNHSGVYYNAYSEDLFFWDNDPNNEGNPPVLNIKHSSLNKLHSLFNEDYVREKLKYYNFDFNFEFKQNENSEKGFDYVFFYKQDPKTNERTEEYIKISRGEEQLFIWGFFLALFESSELFETQSSFFFIDDPVSSLDDISILDIANSIKDLIKENFDTKKIIITTHHAVFFSIISNFLSNGSDKEKYKDKYKRFILRNNPDKLELVSIKKGIFLYHLLLFQTICTAIEENEIYAYHFVLLRQLLENIASFLGRSQFSYVLNEIGISDSNNVGDKINLLSHKRTYGIESIEVSQNDKDLLKKIMENIMHKYNFDIHADKGEDK